MQTLQKFLLIAPVMLFSVIAHEIAHGWAALRQGDRTALDAGRLSWNPVKHIDFFLTILLPLVTFYGSMAVGGTPMLFGGAKPVPVDPRNYRHPRRGDIIVSLAGVATNALIGLVCLPLMMVAGIVGTEVPALQQTLGIVQTMLFLGVVLNAVLIVFNLLPIPPLDGSHVLKYLLPRPLAIRYVQFGRYGLIVLILLLQFGGPFFNVWMTPVRWAENAAVAVLDSHVLPTTAQWLQ